DFFSSFRNKLKGLTRWSKPRRCASACGTFPDCAGLLIIDSGTGLLTWGGGTEISCADLKTGSAESFTVSKFTAGVALGRLVIESTLGAIAARVTFVTAGLGRLALVFGVGARLVSARRGGGLSSFSIWRASSRTACASCGVGLSAAYS